MYAYIYIYIYIYAVVYIYIYIYIEIDRYPPQDVVLTLEDESEFRFDDEGMVELEDFFGLEFRLENRKGKLLKCLTNFDISDPTFRICFPGDYIVEGVGYLEAAEPPSGRDLVKETAAAAAELEVLKAREKAKPETTAKAYNHHTYYCYVMY